MSLTIVCYVGVWEGLRLRKNEEGRKEGRKEGREGGREREREGVVRESKGE